MSDLKALFKRVEYDLEGRRFDLDDDRFSHALKRSIYAPAP